MPKRLRRPRGESATARFVAKWVGKRFGRLTIIGHGGYYQRPSGKRLSLLRCECDCGNICIVQRGNLASDNTTSCGCKRTETIHKQRWRGCGELSGTYWYVVLRNAKARELEVTVTIEHAWELFVKQGGKCALTGLPLRMDRHLHLSRRNKQSKRTQTASLDRIDSSKGYIPGNIRWVHKRVNLMRLDMSDDELVRWCLRILRERKRQRCSTS